MNKYELFIKSLYYYYYYRYLKRNLSVLKKILRFNNRV